MATQWTAGLVDGTPLPAATLNTIGAAWETWTPVLKQGTTTFGLTIHLARYARVQKIVVATVGISVASGTGQLGIGLTLSLPVNAQATANSAFGSAWVYDNSAATAYAAIINGGVATECSFFGDWSGGGTFGGTPNIQFTTNDQIRAYFVYEAA
jgi:hypothetical protein